MNPVVLIFCYILMLIGLVGCILPLLPGTPLVFLGIFIYAWKTHFTIISWNLILIFLIITVISVLLDFIAGGIGSKKMKASKFGVIGAFFGAIAGFFFAPFGIIIGPPLGAFICELFSGKNALEASKASAGAILGILGGTLCKIVLSLIMIGLFTSQVF